MGDDFNYAHILKEFGVGFVDSNAAPFASYEVPGGGSMFDRYTLSGCFADADAVVSVAKMKNHAFMGVTLCMKNLFGLPPITLPAGRVRTYLPPRHPAAIRADRPRADPAALPEHRRRADRAVRPRVGRRGADRDALLAGDHVTATDACGTYLMGHDPASDWPTPAFPARPQPLAGRGPARLRDRRSRTRSTSSPTCSAPVAQFDSVETDPPPIVASWRRTTCEQGLFYRENQRSSWSTATAASSSSCRTARSSGTAASRPGWPAAAPERREARPGALAEAGRPARRPRGSVRGLRPVPGRDGRRLSGRPGPAQWTRS